MFLAVFACALSSVDILWAILSMADLPPAAAADAADADADGDEEEKEEESGHRLQQFDTSALYTKALQLTSSSLPSQTAARAPTTLAFPSNFPSEKRIPATQFVVDGFRWAGPWSLAYFLSHFHSDHYAGLTPLWNKGIIFCSHITAKLLVEHLNVSQAFVFALPMREKVTIDGCEVTLVEANHCPGAVQFLFRVSSTSDGEEYQRYVHTGDMRYCPSFKNEACLCDFIGADAVFLDTTYCNPRFVFPTQQESVDYVAATVLRYMLQQGETKRHTLFLIATYVIGKEKILMTVAKHCKCLIYVSEKKLSLLKCLNLEGDHVFTSNSALTNVHVVGWNFLGQTWPYFRPNFANMEKMMQENNYTRVVGFVPTGWTYELKKEVFSIRKKEPFEIHLVPYSEHSNYHELREYVRFLKPQKVIPTVGLEGGGMDGKAVAAMRTHFRNLVDEIASKRNFLKSYKRKTSGMLASPCKTAAYQSYCKDRLISEQGSSLVIQVNRDNQAFQSPDKSPQEQGLLKQDLSAEPNSQQKRFEAAFGRNARKRRERIEGNAAENGVLGYPFERQSHSTLLSLGFPACVDLKDVANENAMNFPCEGDELEQATEMHLSPTRIVLNVEGESIKDTPIKHEPIQDNSLQNSYEQFSPPAEILEKFVHLHPASSKSHSEGWYAECVPSSQTAPLIISKSKDSSKTSFPLVNKRENAMNSVSSVKKRARIQSPIKGTLQPFEKDRQSSMLDFFKKVRESTSFEAPLALPTLSRNMSLLENDPYTAPECDKSQTHGTGDQYLQRRDEINQLLLILDGGISADHAIFLLEKADGDVGVALDLYEAEKKSEIAYFLTNAGESSVTSKDSRHSYNEILQSIHRPKENLSNLDPKQTEAVSGSAIHSVASPDFSEPVSCSSLGSNKADVSLRSPCKTQAVLIRNQNTTFRSVAIPIGDYHPIRDSCWKVGEPAPYLHLARAFDLVEQESGRLRIIDMLCNMFRSLLSLSPESVLPAAYLIVNRIAPEYEHVDLNIGGNIVTAAISEVAGVPRAKLREMYASVGDLGDVAQACRQKQSVLKLPEHLSIGFVFSTLKQISKESGSGSGERKKRLVINLLRACREKEMKYIVRTLVQNMRIGAMMKSVLSGLAQAVSLHHACPYEQVVGKSLDSLQKKFQEDSASVLEAYNFLPNLEILLPALITSGVSELAQHITIAPGIPIKPMLAKITNGIQDLVDNFFEKTFTCEYKYDGQRAQIHMLSDGSVRIFSRNCEETTSRFPDVVNIIQMSAAKTTRSFIIDTEVVAVDRDNGNKLMSFQHLSTRERGTRDGAPVDVRNIKVDVCVFAFDMMYANNQSLVKLSLNERRQRMHELFPKGRPGYFEFAKEITVEPGSDSMELVVTSQRVEAFLDEAIAASCEGLMAKALIEDSVYRASKRSDSWLKIKRDYVEGLHDTLDLVPIGAWNGNGRKAGWYSPFLMACYDPGREEYQSVCRVMSGFTDMFYKEASFV